MTEADGVFHIDFALDPGRRDAALRKREVARAFGEAAGDYDRYAVLQRRVAGDLAQKITSQEGLQEGGSSYLEIGCGTGFLGEALQEGLAGVPCLFTDISPPMLEKCRDRLEGPLGSAGFAVMDGEAPGLTEKYNLIAASLVFQWFTDLPGAIARLAGILAPGGRLVFAMLGAGSLEEWRVACRNHGMEPGVPSFPSARELDSLWPGGGTGRVEKARILRRHVSARNFLHELKDIGARVPVPDHVPQAPGGMRTLLQEIDGKNGEGENGDGFSVTYHVLYGFFTREGEAS
ncbi:MAG: methyltransferase domain-containing protein [Alphaproteobacteria bacterium]|jgi:malonyl-CoA O-methyltransferase|nr:methyltransferase domain-containing protein [Alphaproteobacteria bacterium]MDP7123005.1 methyltransferase domain-containing protein [Alphaproteobacteria bacterium]MDP7311313.1 methyltransferase domain-containing protein [Alphaproteobacteria bacterium]MDP7468450.1 methyltransferase domain-containing protein [Alphaproteobacteria bacterium]MDP7669514.1 methyltransferase domain-containing protein [Alphaproteobacteria bacterium]